MTEKYFPAVFVCCAIAGGLTECHGTGRGCLACASNKTREYLGVCHVDVALIMLSNTRLNGRKFYACVNVCIWTVVLSLWP